MRSPLLSPFAFLYALVLNIRHKLFDWKMIKSQEYDIPVICVGNITVGGTGKTPVSEYLISYFMQNYNVALLSRGYKRRTKGYLEVETKSSFRDVGDESKQIKLKFPEIVVVVCESRREGIATIRELHPEINLIILDDGFQHRYVEPWINIVLMDYSRPTYKDHLLPWGNLRDVPSQMHRAHMVIVTKCPPDMTPLDERIVKKYLGLYPYQNLFFTSMISGGAVALYPETVPEYIPQGNPIIAMAGVGNPDSYISSLEAKYDVVGSLIFKDHHAYRMSDLERMREALSNAPEGTVIVTTEKDAVKLTNRKRIPADIREKLYFIPINVSFAGDSETEFLRKIDSYVRTNPKHSLLHSQ